MAGCTLGTLMPYRQPVAVALSALWWGLYFGGFGAAIGAIVAEFTGRTKGLRLPGPEEAGEQAMEAEIDFHLQIGEPPGRTCMAAASETAGTGANPRWEHYVTSDDFATRPPAETQVLIELLQVEMAHLQARVQTLEHRLENVAPKT
jgi:hypothetical protein